MYLEKYIGSTVAIRLVKDTLILTTQMDPETNPVILLEELVAVDALGIWVVRDYTHNPDEHHVPGAHSIHVLIPWANIREIAVIIESELEYVQNAAPNLIFVKKGVPPEA